MPLPQVHDMNLDKYNIKIRMKVNPCYYYLKKKKNYIHKQTNYYNILAWNTM